MTRFAIATTLASLLLASQPCAQDAGQIEPGHHLIHLRPATWPGRVELLRRASVAVRADRASPDIVQQLRDRARDAARDITATILEHGGDIRGVLIAPLAVHARIDQATYARLSKHPDVVRLEAARRLRAHVGEATAANNHNATSVHTVQTLRGEGQILGLVDSGVELSFQGGTYPHPAFLDGNGQSRIVSSWSVLGPMLLHRTDQNGHGTGVGAIAVGRQWGSPMAADGFAPAAKLASYRITSGLGTLTTSADLASGYNRMLLDIIGGLEIGVANCSFSGSPDPTAADQQALDTLALYGDVVVVTSCGNLSLPANFDFRASAESQATSNGLAVGAVTKHTHQVAAFSAYGPLDGDGARIYPDLAAIGKNVHTADRLTQLTSTVDGTSYSAPMVAGTALLVRQARPNLDASAIKAILLGSTTDLQAANPGVNANWFGRGLLRSDLAVATAIATLTGFGNGDPHAAHIERGSCSQDEVDIATLGLPPAATISATLVWMRTDTMAPENPDLALEVRDANGVVVARGSLQRNLYERVVFTTTSGDYDFAVRGNRVTGDDVGWTLLINRADGLPSSPAVTIVPAACAGTGIDLAAQTVLPAVPGFGDSRTNKPLADVPGTLQTAYDAAQIGPPRQVRALGFRRARQEGSTPALDVRLRIKLGYTSNPPNGLSYTLTQNFNTGPAPVTAFDDWHRLPPTMPAPDQEDFDFVIPLSTPFALDAVHGNPLVEITVLGNSANNQPRPIGLDAMFVMTGQSLGALVHVAGAPFPLAVQQRPIISFVGNAPRGCEPRLGYSGSPRIGESMTITLADARENALATFALGSGTAWTGTPLPFDLGALGAPGCILAAAPDLAVTVLSDGTGHYELPITWPNDTAMIGLLQTGQWLVFDLAANALGLVSTDAVEMLFGS